MRGRGTEKGDEGQEAGMLSLRQPWVASPGLASDTATPALRLCPAAWARKKPRAVLRTQRGPSDSYPVIRCSCSLPLINR